VRVRVRVRVWCLVSLCVCWWEA